MRINSNGGLVAGVIVGGVVGGLLGVLFAPRAGARTRRLIARSADDARYRSKQLYDGAVETVGDAVDASVKAFDKAVSLVAKAAGTGGVPRARGNA